MTQRTTVLFATLALVSASTSRIAFADVKENARLDESRVVLEELTGIKEGPPKSLLEDAHCVIVVPGVKKAAIGIGGRLGYGVATCRVTKNGAWGPPLMVSLKGGSVGFQIGGQSSDLVLLVMNERGSQFLTKSKVTLGVDASIAAGPMGRNAEAATDLQMRAEILSYSRSRGVFAGISLEGAGLHQDMKATRAVYGRRVEAKAILAGKESAPAASRGFLAAVERVTSR